MEALGKFHSVIAIRVSYRGGGLEFPPPPARNLEIEYGFYISYLHVTEHKYVSSKCWEILSQIVSECVQDSQGDQPMADETFLLKIKIYLSIRSNLRGCKFKNFPGGGGGGGMPPDPLSKHGHISYVTMVMLLSCFPPPSQNPV